LNLSFWVSIEQYLEFHREKYIIDNVKPI